MLKKLSSNGFLYHAGSQQILLERQDPENPNSPWSLLSLSKLKIPNTIIHRVYDYDHKLTGKKQQVSYVEVKELIEPPKAKNTIFSWFSHKEISKLKNISVQTKQDIIVGQRVIDSETRRSSGEQTIG